jgi:RHS repeat-associated protein
LDRLSALSSSYHLGYRLADAIQTTTYCVPFGGNQGDTFSTLTAKRFTGQYHESAIPGGEGLSYYNARWYDSRLGRFVSADTIVPNPRNPQDLNRYSYVRNNPLKYIDPSGHAPGVIHLHDCMCVGYRMMAQAASAALIAQSFALAINEAEIRLPNVTRPAELSPDQESFPLAQASPARTEGIPLTPAEMEGPVTRPVDTSPTIVGDAFPLPSQAGLRIIYSTNTLDLTNYRPGSAFSGVYDPATETFLVRPSGDTVLADGSVPIGRVHRRGGHGVINNELARSAGADPSRTVGFTVFYESARKLSVEWRSGSVNFSNHRDPEAPAQFRQSIMDALRAATGFEVRSR